MKSLFFLFLLLASTQSISSQETPFQTGHTHDILEVKFSPDDSQLISYSAGDGWLCLWEVKTGRLLWKSETSFIQRGNEYYALQEFYWSDERDLMVTKSDNGTYQIWDAKTGKILSISETKPDVKLDVKNRIIPRRNNDTSRSGELVATGGRWGDASIKITDTKTGESYFLDGHPSVIKALAYSPDGNYLVVAGSDKNIYIFDAAKRTLWKTLTGHTRPISAMAFSPDGKFLISSSEYELMKVWNWQEGKFLQDIKSAEDSLGVQKISFNSDGKYFLTTSEGADFKIWDSQTLKLVHNYKTKEKYESTSGDMTIGYSSVPVLTAIFANDRGRVLSSHADGTLRTWDISSGKQIGSLKIGKAPFVLMSPDTKTILAAITQDEGFQIKLFNAKDGREIRRFDDGETGYLEALSISPNGKNFATSDISGDVFLWDVNNNRPIRELEIGFSGDDAIAFSPDGKTLAVGGRNQNLFLFDVATGNKLWQLIPSYEPSALEIRLKKEKEQRRAVLNEAKASRDKQAAIDTEVFKKQVYITFEHYGEMTDPGQQRMIESDEPNKSKVKKSERDANAIWLRLHNDSPLPIKIPTRSMYMPKPKCFYEFTNGQKILGLCANREISIWFGLEDKEGKQIPYGFDFGSSVILLPKTSVLFAVPREILKNGKAIRFNYTFQKETDENKVEVYGTDIVLRFKESDLP